MAAIRDLSEYVQEHLKEYLPPELAEGEIIIRDVVENNGITLTGVTVELPENRIMPVIFLDKYVNGVTGEVDEKDFEVICRRVADEEVRRQPEVQEDLEKLVTADYLKSHSFLCAVNTMKNMDLISHVPHEEYLDLSAIVKCDLDIPQEDALLTVSNDVMKSAGISKEELFSAAKENMLVNNPPFIESMEKMLKGMGIDVSENPEEGMILEGSSPMYVCTNEKKEYGAAVIFLPEVQEKMSAIAHGDFFVLPSSVHEVLCLPADRAPAPPHEMQAMVQEINANEVAPAEVLSDCVYKYDAKEKRLDIASAPVLQRDMII